MRTGVLSKRDSKDQRERQRLKTVALAAVRQLFYCSITPSEAIIDLADVRAEIDGFRKTIRGMGLGAKIPQETAK